MDKRHVKVQAAGKQVPAGWIHCDELRKAELKAFAKGKNDTFFPGGWLMTADMLAAAQTTGYTLSNVAETSSSSSSSGNALGTGISNPNANSNEADGTGNVPNSAQGTGSSLTVPQSTNANEESPSARPDGEEESADYASEE